MMEIATAEIPLSPKVVLLTSITPSFMETIAAVTPIVEGAYPDDALYIVDIDLTFVDGIETCRRLRAEKPRANLLIVVSARVAEKYHTQLKRAGATGFVEMNCDVVTLKKAIETTFQGTFFCDSTLPNVLPPRDW